MTSKLNRLILLVPYFIAVLCLFITHFTNAQSQCSALSKPTVKYTFGQGTSPYSDKVPSDFGFSTTYTLENGNQDNRTNDGDFSFVNLVADPWDVWHRNIVDHTQDGDGYLMLINASYDPGEFYRDTVEGLCNGIQYEFSVWAGNADKRNGRIKPNVRFVILDAYTADTLAEYETGDLAVFTNFRWERHAVEFDATTDKVVLLLINNNPGGLGNDLVLDDIAFTPCLPVYDIVGDSIFCIGENLELSPLLLASSYATPEYLWQKRKPDMSWEDIIIAENLSQPGMSLADTGWYQLFVAELGTMVSQAQCRSYDSIYVDIIKPLSPGKIAATETICYNTAPNFFSSVQNATSATETISYQWEFSNNLTTWSNASSTSNTFQETTLTADRHYRRKATTDCYTEYSDTITISVYDELTNNVIADDQIVCDSETPTLTSINNMITGGEGSYEFQWQSSTDATTWNNIDGETANSYQSPLITEDTYIRLVAKDICGDRNSNEISLDYQLTPMPDSIIETICEGSPLPNLTVAGTSIQWYNVSLNQIAPPSFSNTTLGTQSYFVSETILGCESELSPIKLTVYSRPVISLTPQAECEGDSAQFIPSISGGNPVFNYKWYNASGIFFSSDSTLDVKTETSTLFSLTVSDQYLCSDSSSILLTKLDKPELTLADTNLCEGDRISIIPNITNATGTISYDWFESSVSFATSPIIDFDKTTTSSYSLIISDANNCKDTADITINVFPSVTISLRDTSMCDYSEVPLTTNIELATYQWSPTSVMNDATIRNPIAKPNTTTKIYLNSTDENNCAYRDSLIITVFTKPVTNITPVSAICVGDSAQLLATSDKSVKTYRWYSNAGTLSNATISNPYSKPLTTTTYNLEITDTEDCIDSTEITVTVNPLPIIDAGPDVKICSGLSTTLNATGNATIYSWSPSANLNNPNIANPTANPTSTTVYRVTGTSAFNCKDTSSVKVTVFNSPVPTISIQYDRDVCIGDEVSFTIASSSYLGDAPIYQWHQINPDNSDNIISSTNSSKAMSFEDGTSFYLEAISNEICVASSDKNVISNTVTPKVYQYPDLSITGPKTVCYGEPAIFQTTDNNNVTNTFTWLTNKNTVLKNSPEQQYVFASLAQDQQIKVAATNPNFNCVDTSILLTVKPIEVFLDIFADDTLLFYDASTNVYFATNADSLHLNTTPFDGSPQLLVNMNILPVTPPETTTYTGNAFIGACEATDSVKIRILPQVSAPYFFSPNGDGQNDIWIIKDLEKWPITRVVLLNRWGMEVTRLGNREHTWDGKNRSGHPLPDGVYYYVIEAGIKDLDKNKIINFSGYVTVTK